MRQLPHALRLTTEEQKENSRAEPSQQQQQPTIKTDGDYHVRIEHLFPPFDDSIHHHDINSDSGKRRIRIHRRPEGAPLFTNPF